MQKFSLPGPVRAGFAGVMAATTLLLAPTLAKADATQSATDTAVAPAAAQTSAVQPSSEQFSVISPGDTFDLAIARGAAHWKFKAPHGCEPGPLPITIQDMFIAHGRKVERETDALIVCHVNGQASYELNALIARDHPMLANAPYLMAAGSISSSTGRHLSNQRALTLFTAEAQASHSGPAIGILPDGTPVLIGVDQKYLPNGRLYAPEVELITGLDQTEETDLIQRRPSLLSRLTHPFHLFSRHHDQAPARAAASEKPAASQTQTEAASATQSAPAASQPAAEQAPASNNASPSDNATATAAPEKGSDLSGKFGFFHRLFAHHGASQAESQTAQVSTTTAAPVAKAPKLHFFARLFAHHDAHAESAGAPQTTADVVHPSSVTQQAPADVAPQSPVQPTDAGAVQQKPNVMDAPIEQPTFGHVFNSIGSTLSRQTDGLRPGSRGLTSTDRATMTMAQLQARGHVPRRTGGQIVVEKINHFFAPLGHFFTRLDHAIFGHHAAYVHTDFGANAAAAATPSIVVASPLIRAQTDDKIRAPRFHLFDRLFAHQERPKAPALQPPVAPVASSVETQPTPISVDTPSVLKHDQITSEPLPPATPAPSPVAINDNDTSAQAFLCAWNAARDVVTSSSSTRENRRYAQALVRAAKRHLSVALAQEDSSIHESLKLSVNDGLLKEVYSESYSQKIRREITRMFTASGQEIMPKFASATPKDSEFAEPERSLASLRTDAAPAPIAA